jgi:hypothetical protein
MMSFSWASSLFGLRQFGGVLAPSRASAADFEHVTRAAETEMDGPIRSFFRVGDRIQRDTLNMLLGAFPSARNGRAASTGSQGAGGRAQANQPPRSARSAESPQSSRPPQSPGRQTQPTEPTQPTRPAQPTQQRTSPSAPTYRVNRGRLDTSCFVVIGEGLAAGMGDFALSEETQCESFPAQMARQMQTDFPQPLIQAPGVCYPVGFAKTPVLVPRPLQTTVFDRIPPTPVNNLSVPGLRLADARRLRPAQPLIRRDSHKLTALNLALGVLHFARGEEGPAPTPLEYALARRPTLALVELGYHEALEAAVTGDLDKMPGADSFRTEYSRLLAELRGAGAEVVALTVPDPFDTAYFSTLEEASNVVKTDPAVLLALYGLGGDKLLTVHGLHEIGFQLFGQSVGPLPENATQSREVARRVSARVAELNDAIASAARECGALVYDLHGLFRMLKTRSYNTGTRALTCEYLGGFYSLNGYYPGATGHAIIADELLHFLNLNYGADFPQVDVGSVSQTDPVADYRPAGGPCWTLDNLPRPGTRPPGDAGDFALGGGSSAGGGSAGREPSGWEALGQPEGGAPTTLRLPPNLEQTLPLSKAASYFGDGIGAVNCRDQQGVQFGSCAGWLFGGLAMVDSHLSGNLRIRFTPPVNNVTQFVISFEGGLAGDDAVLCAPQLFKMWFRQARVDEVPGLVSSGTLDLSNGMVSDLQVYGSYASTALAALVGSNPTFPRVPITFRNESTSQYYGSAWATFGQRDDGLLDFTFYGSMFAPLGPGIRWPLNFVGPSGQFATIPAAGTVMHPHLHLSTKEPASGGECPEIPFNTIQELTLFSHNSCFGDAFTLDASQLGGKATGRSHLLGRLLLQYGARSGNTVPVAVAAVVPGGVMAELSPSPITQVFPGRLYPGPVGFDEFLRFPLRTYSLDDLAIIDDPFDISVGAVDLRTGRFVNDLLHRGFINQDLIFALLRVEPRTPGSSFNFRGPALLERGPGGGTLFRFLGSVFIPYPEGFFFPTPNLTTGFPIGPNSRLDPFLWMHAIADQSAGDYVKSGGERDVLSSTGERFSYHYTIPQDASKRGAVFEYENHTQQGKFRLHSLAWVGFGNARAPGREGGRRRGRHDYDTVSFTGFGVWSKDGVETLLQVAAQFSTAPGRKYIGIQVDSGNVSNVNTKPPNIDDARP